MGWGWGGGQDSEESLDEPACLLSMRWRRRGHVSTLRVHSHLGRALRKRIVGSADRERLTLGFMYGFVPQATCDSTQLLFPGFLHVFATRSLTRFDTLSRSHCHWRQPAFMACVNTPSVFDLPEAPQQEPTERRSRTGHDAALFCEALNENTYRHLLLARLIQRCGVPGPTGRSAKRSESVRSGGRMSRGCERGVERTRPEGIRDRLEAERRQQDGDGQMPCSGQRKDILSVGAKCHTGLPKLRQCTT